MFRNSRFPSRPTRARSGIPIFFKLWFAFVAVLVMSVFGFYIFVAVQAVSMADDPEAIGSYVGEIVKGFNDTVNGE